MTSIKNIVTSRYENKLIVLGLGVLYLVLKFANPSPEL